MAECQYYHASYFYITMYADICETASNYHKVNWRVVMHHSRLSVSSFSFNWWCGDDSGSFSYGGISCGSGGQDRQIGSGTVTIWHTGARNCDFGFSSGIRWRDYTKGGYLAYDPSAGGSFGLPQLVVNPSLPTWASFSGNNGTWVSKDDPRINASWGGASSGTYTIQEYSVDILPSGGGWSNSGSVWTSAGSGSVSNRSLSGWGLQGGQTLRLRVGMKTSDGTWWGHRYCDTVLNVYSRPSAPTTFSAPSAVEIDKGFSLTWGGASAGSNGIAGYDLQARAYNGSSWTGWENILVCKNQSSYSVGKIKDLNVNGVSYSSNGEKVKFQYRIRTSDGIISTSDWKESAQISIQINNPNPPRNSWNLCLQ